MSMTLPIFIGAERIGTITVARRSKVPEEVNLYDWQILVDGHNGEPPVNENNDPDEPISHYRADGALVLLAKVLEAAKVEP